MVASLRCLVWLAVIAPAAAWAEEPRRVRSEVLSRVLEDREKYPVDARLEDIPEEERAKIEPAPPASKPVRSVERKKQDSDEAVMMDPVVVEERRVNPLRRQLHEHDRAVAAEEAATVPTALDAIINHPALSILGGASASARAARARRNMRIMETERLLLIAIQMAETEAEKQELKLYLAELREIRRY